MKRIIYSLLILPSFFVLLSDTAFAQELLKGNDCLYKARNARGGLIDNVVTLECVPVLIANLIYWLIIFSGTVAVFLIIFGGIKYLTSGGDQAKLESAKKTITWTIIGLILIISSFMIVNVIGDLTGVTCISSFPTLGFDSCKP